MPENLDYCLYSTDMNKKILCKGCNKVITFGEAYTSMEHFNHAGFGYGVCESCYEKEYERRKLHES